MTLFITVFVFLSISLLSLLYLLPKIINNKPRSDPPGPRGLPIIGNLHQIHQSTFHTSLWNLSKSYGPVFSIHLGSIPAIVVSSASLAKEVLKTQDRIFCNRPSLIGQQKVSYNGMEVIFSPSNNFWREMRKIFMVHLLGPKSVRSFRYIREDEVSRATRKIHELASVSSTKVVNLSELTKSVAITIMTRVGFGKRYQDGHEKKEVFHFLSEIQAMFTDFFVSDLWPGLPFAGLVDRLLGKTGRLDKCFQFFDLLYKELIEEHVKTQDLKSHEEEDDFIDILLQLKEEFNLTYDHMKGLLMDVLVAGTDTSSATVVWAMTALMKNPTVMKKVQEEVRNVVGKKGKVDEDDLPKLTYMKAVIKETMRLYPTVPLLVPRELAVESTLNGYKIKPKTLVFVSVLAIGRDPESWDQPEEFIPERFLDSDIDFKGNDFEFIPFGAGRRICPGILMGVVTVDLLLANLLYLFDWGFPNGMMMEDLDFEVMPGITMHKRNELCLVPYVYM